MTIRLCISGISGRMGQIVERLARADAEIDPILGIDAVIPRPADGLFGPARLEEALRQVDVLLGFTNNPQAAVEQTHKAAELGVKVVIATTGFSEEQEQILRALACKVPLIKASNFSLGINLLEQIVAQIAGALPWGYHPEIVEEHHARKLDAPSGTAETLAKAVAKGWKLDATKLIERGRSGRAKEVRRHDTIGIQAVRGGNIAGNHQVLFAGPSENIRVCHEALSPQVFAEGALVAVKWIFQQDKPGWYSMARVLGLE